MLGGAGPALDADVDGLRPLRGPDPSFFTARLILFSSYAILAMLQCNISFLRK
jgi:hypothetical protein